MTRKNQVSFHERYLGSWHMLGFKCGLKFNLLLNSDQLFRVRGSVRVSGCIGRRGVSYCSSLDV